MPEGASGLGEGETAAAARRLTAAACELESALSQDELVERMNAILGSVGIEFWIYVTAACDGDAPILLSNIELHDASGGEVFDPFLDWCCESYEPSLTGVEYMDDYPYLDERSRTFIRRAGALGFRSGVGIPVRLAGSPVYGGFNFGTRLDRAAFAERYVPLIDALRAFALIAHRRIEELAVPAEVEAARAADAPLPDLTAREIDVLRSLAGGASRRQCADQLGISEHTVASHTRSIYDKLQVGNRVEAAAAAMRAGLVEMRG